MIACRKNQRREMRLPDSHSNSIYYRYITLIRENLRKKYDAIEDFS
ncbi:hypothetical protein CES86_3635 [Brucella lupini]|uniref:Uncharacterized protein n=1 Tax=Brucella lupini TaxID=255457 RepID=A0A256GHR9_9HYPH|nr:hypothetical protein CES86_3635 [Brucella lupini]